MAGYYSNTAWAMPGDFAKYASPLTKTAVRAPYSDVLRKLGPKRFKDMLNRWLVGGWAKAPKAKILSSNAPKVRAATTGELPGVAAGVSRFDPRRAEVMAKAEAETAAAAQAAARPGPAPAVRQKPRFAGARQWKPRANDPDFTTNVDLDAATNPFGIIPGIA